MFTEFFPAAYKLRKKTNCKYCNCYIERNIQLTLLFYFLQISSFEENDSNKTNKNIVLYKKIRNGNLYGEHCVISENLYNEIFPLALKVKKLIVLKN